MAPSLRELLNEPFGPYTDSEVLAETLKSTRTKMLGLHRVFLSCRGEPTGLTNCEPSQHEFNTGNAQIDVEGTLFIRKLEWLSPEGKDLVQDDLQDRHPSLASMTLRNLYGRSSTSKPLGVKVRIRAVKNMTAVYLLSVEVPFGLFIKTEDRYRGYEICSMDPVTYQLSALYLSRYRTLRVIKDIVKYDTEQSEEPTPPKHRHPNWFASMYLRRFRRAEEDAVAVHLSSDSEHETDSEAEAESHTVRPRIVRPLLHQSRAEILLMFAKHVEWLVEQQRRRKQDRYFDWGNWIFIVKHARRRARGDEDALLAQFTTVEDEDEDEDEDEGEQEMQVDDDAVSYRSSSPPVLGRPALKRKAITPARSTTVYSSSSVRQRTPSPLGSPPASLPGPGGLDDLLDKHDVDFSDPSDSDSDWSDSDASLASRPPTPPPPVLLKRIPYVLLHPPKLPKYSFKWDCPVDGCSYSTDLLRPTEEEWKYVPAYGKEKFGDVKKWSSADGWVQQYFDRVVARHYKEHFDELGIDARLDGKAVRFGWANLPPRPRVEKQPVKPEAGP
ncbi:hypothetical protein EUX98_g98 [Antrodiella citrinella]|uniref:Uncharacterized protein n=1 Tax=Antrodiella citrinella TaxID=2447956 RepID=A0A4S4N509_9APHY|nr:hypothetical protein EUX98_g98 [Antrodiella citrinella]